MTADHEEAASASDQLVGAGPRERVIRVTLPMAAQAAGLARQCTREALALWNLSGLEDAAVLLVSELVSNVVRHARSDSGLELRISAGRSLVIAVTDGDPRPPRPRHPASLDETGFGFVVIDALASSWGVDTTATGKTVWVELDSGRPDQPSRRSGTNPALTVDTGPPVLVRGAVTSPRRTSARRPRPAIRRSR